MWLRELLSEMGLEIGAPTALYEDNEAALFLSENPAVSCNRPFETHQTEMALFAPVCSGRNFEAAESRNQGKRSRRLDESGNWDSVADV